MPLLVQSWGECAPMTVDNRTCLDAMIVILRVARTLASSVHGTPIARMGALCKALMAPFPFTTETVALSAGAGLKDLQQLNLGICDVVVQGLLMGVCGKDAIRE